MSCLAGGGLILIAIVAWEAYALFPAALQRAPEARQDPSLR